MAINPWPSFRSRDEENAAYHACGRLALFWGPVELTIEQIIVIFRNRQNDTQGAFPVSFSRKLKELKDRLKAEPTFSDVRDDIRPLLSEAKVLHRFRTNVVHAYFQGQNIDGQLMFGISDQKRGVAYTENLYTIADIEQKTDAMIALEGQLSELWQECNSRAWR